MSNNRADLARMMPDAFLQRIGRGNRRTGICRVVGFRSSDDDEQLMHALLDCGRRGDLDDVYEYDRPSVRFQQVLSLAWRATREDRSLTEKHLAAEAGTDEHTRVVHDMLATGCLVDLRGALVPSDRLVANGHVGDIATVGKSAAAQRAVAEQAAHAAVAEEFIKERPSPEKRFERRGATALSPKGFLIVLVAKLEVLHLTVDGGADAHRCRTSADITFSVGH